MTKVKICGLKRPEDIKAANMLKPDYVGFVFAGTKRRIDDKQAEALRRALNPAIPAVGVFVNEPFRHIIRLVKNNTIQLIQLHGEEKEEEIHSLKSGLIEEGYQNVPIIKAVRVRNTGDIISAQKLPCDMLLLDAYSPRGEYGGTGAAFDTGLIPPLSKPFFLAGGLNCENIRGLVDKIKPYGVDVSSGVETNGYKDEVKIEQFLSRVRRNL